MILEQTTPFVRENRYLLRNTPLEIAGRLSATRMAGTSNPALGANMAETRENSIH
jgi:hypothetical protein